MQNQIEEMAELICDNFADGRCATDGCACNHNCEYNARAAALYDEGFRKQAWISVEEHLPENNGNIITYQGNSQEIGVYYYCGNGEWVDNRGDFASSEYYGITHWMPMPKPPKGE